MGLGLGGWADGWVEEGAQAALGSLRVEEAGAWTRARKGWDERMEAAETSKEEDRRLGVGLDYSLGGVCEQSWEPDSESC